MKNYFISIIILSLPFVWTVSAQQVPPSVADQIRWRAEQKRPLPSHLSKINAQLREAMWRVRGTGAATPVATRAALEQALGPHGFTLDQASRVHIVLRADEITPELLDRLAALQFKIEASTDDLNVSANHQSISGWAYFDRLDALARLSAIFSMRPAVGPISHVGAINSEGDTIHNVRDTRLYLGVDGTGQSVGVISTGVDHLADAQSLGELPFGVTVLSNARGCIANGTDCGCKDGTFGCDVRDEGTAMLEIVHDLAPGANLLFTDSGGDPVEFARRIVDLTDNGSMVIVDDIGWLTAPVYNDGIIAQTVDDVVNNRDIVYVSAAGNSTDGARYHAAQFTDADLDGWHEFTPEIDETLNVEIPVNSAIGVFLQWNNAYARASDDYDLYLFDSQMTELLAISDDIQNGAGDPLEMLFFANPSPSETISVAIGIKRSAGEARHLTLFLGWRRGTFPLIEPHPGTNSVTVWGHAAAQHSLAVGAINAGDPNLKIAPYSSRGPTRIYSYGNDGRPVAFSERSKPDLAGIDDVSITGVGGFGSSRCRESVSVCFRGTSAAAPHVAAIAALVRASKPQAGALEVRQILSDTALDLGAAGRDLIYGEGLVDALASVRQACATCNNLLTRLFNISTNGLITAAGMQAGFIVRGNAPKRFIVFAERLNSPIDPVLRVTDLTGNIEYDSNDNWQSHPTAGEIVADLRAPGDDLDAGFALTLDPGSYIARMSSANEATGAGIVAINDVDVAFGDTQLLNISTNGVVDGEGLFAGFIVQEDGGTAQRFIIYAERFSSAIDPILSVTNLAGDLVYDSNDNWQSHLTAGEVQARLRAPGHELDAAFAITLPPGIYIARMQSRNGQIGTGVVAISDVSAL